MDKYVKFKHLLEYFVSHLQWVVNGDKNHLGYEKYIEPIADFKTAGYGWKGEKIQQQIAEWDTYDGYKVSICIYASAKQSSAGNYLVWNDTWVNVRPKWQNKEIEFLYLTREEKGDAKEEQCCSLADLGLFDEQEPNENLKNFFNQYFDMMIEYFIGPEMKTCIDLLKSNKNLILTGAPGTGKTYLAKRIASQMILEKECGRKEMTPEEQKIFDEHFEFVQFHPSYDYTDFVEGLRPTKDAMGNIGFERQNGVFKKFCAEALSDVDKKYVFIIDEINRGDISKIFGELFFSIDPGYRGEDGRVQTQYQNMIDKDGDDEFRDGFYVPENVYIIGTMNDIDRSVESMDFAMRRRFAWKEIKAKDTQNMLDDLGDDEKMKGQKYKMDSNGIQAAKNRMDNLNKKMEEEGIGLNSAYHIGAAYFMKLANYDGTNAKRFEKLWENHLEGVLREYLRGDESVESKISELHKAFNNENLTGANGVAGNGTNNANVPSTSTPSNPQP